MSVAVMCGFRVFITTPQRHPLLATIGVLSSHMFTDAIEYWLIQTEADQITEVFVFLMASTFVLALALKYASEWRAFTAYTPTLLTSLGILGTFFGVVVGLLDFDPLKIDESIGSLLAGLQTAFISSLVGMGLSILYKIAILTPPFQESATATRVATVTIDSLYEQGEEQIKYLKVTAKALASTQADSVLKHLAVLSEGLYSLRGEVNQGNSERRQAEEEQSRVLNKIHSALSDDGESSLTGQMKLVRSDANDMGRQHSAHLESIQTLAQDLTESHHRWQSENKQLLESSFEQLHAIRRESKEQLDVGREQRDKMVTLLERSPTETLVAALEDVIRDFNAQLTEQFGQNFKELNVAVGRMVDWQENYRDQIGDLQNSFESSLHAVTQCEQSLAAIDKQAESIPAHMQKLADIVRVCQHQLNDLENHLKAFAEVKQQAVDSVPTLNGIVDNVVKKVGDTTTRMIQGCESGNQLLVSAMQSSANDLKDAGSQFKDSVHTTTHSLGNETNSMLAGLQDSMQEQFKLSNENMQKLITKEFQDLDDARKAQMLNITQQMGAALASISGQFTRDYQELVNAMKVVVAQSKVS